MENFVNPMMCLSALRRASTCIPFWFFIAAPMGRPLFFTVGEISKTPGEYLLFPVANRCFFTLVRYGVEALFRQCLSVIMGVGIMWFFLWRVINIIHIALPDECG